MPPGKGHKGSRTAYPTVCGGPPEAPGRHCGTMRRTCGREPERPAPVPLCDSIFSTGSISMKRLFFALAVAVALAATAVVGAGQGPGAASDRLTADVLKGIELRSIGPTLATGRVADVADRSEEPERLVRRPRVRRRCGRPTNRGITFTPIFDERRIVHPVLRRHRSEGLERRLARHGREHQPAQRALRRRRLQVDRRRQDLEARGPGDVRAHRQDPHRPAQLERRLRRVAGPAVVGRRRARPLQDHRRRRDVDGRR